jgi:predicted TIM-barrel fold metal-dependent hydrolase
VHIDFHIHLALKEIEYIYDKARHSRPHHLARAKPIQLLSVEELVADLDQASIDQGVFLADGRPGKEVSPELLLSSAIKALGIHAARFILFAGTRLFPSIWEGERGVAQFLAFLENFQVKGLKIIPSGEGRYPNDPAFHSLYEAMCDSRRIIIFHTGQSFFPESRLKFNHPLALDDVAVDFPALRIVMAHFGFPWFMEALSIARRHSNVFVDISALTMVALEMMPWKLIESSIADKVLFGSDYPIHRPSEAIRVLDRLPIRSETKEKIMGANAYRLLWEGKQR